MQMSRALFLTTIANGGGAAPVTMASWQAKTDPVHVAGLSEASWAATATFAAGYTTVMPGYAFRQNGLLNKIRINVVAFDGSAWVFKILTRTGATNCTLKDSVTFTPTATGPMTIDVVPPIAVAVGDCVGLYTPAGNTFKVSIGEYATYHRLMSCAGNVGTSGLYTITDGTRSAIDMDVFCQRPYLATTGDSIMEGSGNSTTHWFALADNATPLTIPGGGLAADPAYETSLLITGLRYQNLAYSGKKWDWVSTTGIGLAAASLARYVCVLVGTNDIQGATDWATVEGQMNTTKAGLAIGQKLLVCEILPRTGFDDTKAATVRTWNASYATWCAANGATLIPCHDAMGQVRGTTGEIDDLVTAYNLDNIHITAAGVAKLASLIAPYIV